MRRARFMVSVLTACVLGIGCERSSAPPEPEHSSNTGTGTPERVSSRVPEHVSQATSTIDGVTPGGECLDVGASADTEIAAQASARIPLKKGLTLVHAWRRGDGADFECLHQITAVDLQGVVIAVSCPTGKEGALEHFVRRVCRSDLRDAFTTITAVDEDYPETFRGTVNFSLSRKSFLALRDQGETRHRYIEFLDPPNPGDGPFTSNPAWSSDGTLRNEGTSTFKVMVNDRSVELPVIEATRRSPDDARVIRVQVLDDERFPLLLDYYMPGRNKFFITYTRISFPTDGEIERRLATGERLDVYGIYFDVGRDLLRAESEPVLREIADALAAHPSWTLQINGHTDSIGDAAANLDLSKRRSDAVRRALIERFSIEGARLVTEGHGASQPKASNDTSQGRALNRRVELIRR